jgi:hypothetical protein
MGCGQRGQGFGGDNPLLAKPPPSLSGFEPFLLFPVSGYFPFLPFLKEKNVSSSIIRGEIPRNPPNALSGLHLVDESGPLLLYAEENQEDEIPCLRPTTFIGFNTGYFANFL